MIGITNAPKSKPEYPDMFRYWIYHLFALSYTLDGMGIPYTLAKSRADKGRWFV